jgi:DNA polymerase-3 subunit alpha
LKEKEVLGINIKYNFFYQYAHRFPNKKLVKISDITKEGNVEMLLMIKSIRPHTTKKNEPMAFVEFTDDTGDLSGVLFPRVYLASSFMKVGMIALVYGKIEERNQRKQLVVEKLTTV